MQVHCLRLLQAENGWDDSGRVGSAQNVYTILHKSSSKPGSFWEHCEGCCGTPGSVFAVWRQSCAINPQRTGRHACVVIIGFTTLKINISFIHRVYTMVARGATMTLIIFLIALLLYFQNSLHSPTRERGARAPLEVDSAPPNVVRGEGGSPLADFVELLAIPNLDLDGKTCMEITLATHQSYSSVNVPDTQPEEQELPGDRAPRTLFYVSFEYVNSAMDRHFVHTYCGAHAVDADAVQMWGPGVEMYPCHACQCSTPTKQPTRIVGWPGWSDAISPAKNVARRWPQPFQLVITIHYSPEEISLDNSLVYATTRFECVYYEHEPSSIDRFKCAVGGKNRYPWRSFNITLLTYETNLHELHDELVNNHTGAFTGQEDALIYFWPHTALPGTFITHFQKAGTHIHKPHDICLLGRTDAENALPWYPLRNKLSAWFEAGRFEEYGLRAASLPHPSYYENELSAEERAERNISVWSAEEQYARYNQFVAKCKLTFVTRSFRNVEVRIANG